MRGLYDELREATLGLQQGRLELAAAREMLQAGATRLGALRGRNLIEEKRTGRAPYTDEINEIETALQELLIEVEKEAPRVRIFHRPGRNVQLPPIHPGGPPTRGRLPDIQVVLIGQVEFIELDGRLRVRDWWELLLDGKRVSPPVQGPKRWIMKNAAGAAMMNATGAPPAWMLLTGLARRRALHKRRRDRKRKAAFRRAVRQANRGHRMMVLRGSDVRVDLRFGSDHPRAGERLGPFTLADLQYNGQG